MQFSLSRTILSKLGSNKTTQITIKQIRDLCSEYGIEGEEKQDEFLYKFFRILGVIK